MLINYICFDLMLALLCTLPTTVHLNMKYMLGGDVLMNAYDGFPVMIVGVRTNGACKLCEQHGQGKVCV